MDRPTLPKGTRDFGPAVMAKRQFIFQTIRSVFERYGFLPLETPAMENLSTLTGKYGEEGDKLLFRVLDSGEFYEKLISKEKLKTLQVTGEMLQKLEGALAHSIENLVNNLNTKYPKIGVSPTEFLAIRNEVVHNDSLWKSIVPSEIADREKDLLLNFLGHETNFITFLAIDILSNLKTKDVNGKTTPFDKIFNSNYGSQVSFILTDFLNNYQLLKLDSKAVSREIAEKGLKYDLTVPFARYVVMNRHEITFPFKRYQIQPVWRADRPQKGRYREFYQCDADVIGTDSLVCEAEIILMITDVFTRLGIQSYTIKINHRGVLAGLATLAGAGDKEGALFVAIDKLDKIGEASVKEELTSKGFSPDALTALFDILNARGSSREKIVLLRQKLGAQERSATSINDLEKVLDLVAGFGASTDKIELDIALARGLSYYTGCIFEVKIHDATVGSVSGGGRYDNLTAVFDSKEKSSGVGFSFGVDRLYDAMEELNLFPEETQRSSHVLVCHLDEACMRHGMGIVQTLRTQSIAAEIYPDTVKLKKQMEYADRKKIPFCIVIGSDEMKSGVLAVKNLKTGEQHMQTLAQFLSTQSK